MQAVFQACIEARSATTIQDPKAMETKAIAGWHHPEETSQQEANHVGSDNEASKWRVGSGCCGRPVRCSCIDCCFCSFFVTLLSSSIREKQLVIYSIIGQLSVPHATISMRMNDVQLIRNGAGQTMEWVVPC